VYDAPQTEYEQLNVAKKIGYLPYGHPKKWSNEKDIEYTQKILATTEQFRLVHCYCLRG
jgi:hypothetical protein